MATIAQWLWNTRSHLEKAGSPTPRLDAEVILAHVLGKNRTWLVAHADDQLTPASVLSADELIVRRTHREPIAYLTGHKEFYGRDFIVTPATLVPRPESESIIELVRAQEVHGHVLDVGTGSGCLGITIALELPTTTVTLSDISDAALVVARKNAERLGVPIAGYVASDLLHHWERHDASAQFTAIIANLPYVSRDWEVSPETAYEPKSALFADDGGLALMEKLIDQAGGHLSPGGYLFLEADPSQHATLRSKAAACGFSFVAADDYALCLQLI